MRPLYLFAASALALTATACAPKTPVARAALDCPMRQGDLSRTSASADGAKDADKAAKEAAEDAKDSGVHVEVKDGKTVVTTGNEDGDGNVRVNLPGIHVVANENDDSAQVSVGPIHIDAGGGRNTVRIRRDVRLRGEALNPTRRGIRATFIYTGVDLPDGYHFVGYEAGGPKSGPITVAVVKSKAGDAEDDELYPDVKKLVRKNGGV